MRSGRACDLPCDPRHGARANWNWYRAIARRSGAGARCARAPATPRADVAALLRGAALACAGQDKRAGERRISARCSSWRDEPIARGARAGGGGGGRPVAMRVAIAHPDLGLGGAERLIVDAAQTLCDRGHEVVVYTARHDPARCFEETRSGAFKVVVRGGWIPRHVFGRLHALCAYARCVWLAMCLALALRGRVDAVLCDQVSAMVPVLHALLWRSAPTLFYCHFPDMLLASRATLLRRLYRAPVDCVEQASTGCASTVLVNSRYTGGVFAQTFAALHARGLKPKVLYPAVDLAAHAPPASTAEKAATERCVPEGVLESPGTDSLLLSINRFERKKVRPSVSEVALVGLPARMLLRSRAHRPGAELF